MPFFGPPLHQHATTPPPQRSGLSNSSFTSFGCGSAMSAVCAYACHRSSIHHPPVDHGRGLATRPGCADPRAGIDSASLRLHRFRRVSLPRPSRFRLRLRSSMPGERLIPPVSAQFIGVNRPGFLRRRSGSRLAVLLSDKLQKSSHRTRGVGQRSLSRHVSI